MVFAFTVSFICMEHQMSWRFMIGINAVPGLVLALGVTQLPESPYTHIAKGRFILAAKVLRECSIDESNLPTYSSKDKAEYKDKAYNDEDRWVRVHQVEPLVDRLHGKPRRP